MELTHRKNQIVRSLVGMMAVATMPTRKVLFGSIDKTHLGTLVCV